MPKPRLKYYGENISDDQREESYTEDIPAYIPLPDEEESETDIAGDDYAAQEFADILDQNKGDEVTDDELGTGPDGEPTQDELQAAREGVTNAAGDTMGALYEAAENFSYETAPNYADKYTPQIDSLLAHIYGNSYQSYLNSANYKALEKQYKENARRGMLDTLGQVSARTGGLASSYATQASQQSYNNEMNALEQAALEMYGNQQATAFGNFGEDADGEDPEYEEEGTDDELGTDSSTLFDDMFASGSPAAYLAANYKKYGIAYSAIAKVIAEYEKWAERSAQTETTPAPGTDTGNNADDTSDEPEYNVTNNHGDSWVHVIGFGRLSWQELEYYVEKGQIVEQINGSSVKYIKAK